MPIHKLRHWARWYRVAHRSRLTWYNLRWRLAVIALTAVALFYVWSHLGMKYTTLVTTETEAFFLNEKLFDWFMIGFITGILALALLFEGEFLLGLRRIIRQVESGAAKEWLALRHALEREALAARRVEALLRPGARSVKGFKAQSSRAKALRRSVPMPKSISPPPPLGGPRAG